MSETDPKAKIIEFLAENRHMSVATIRPDGWPQSTLVGYVNDDLTLYFAVARSSQKFANIERETRISIALGRETADRLRGLSMAARAAEVSDPGEIQRLNGLLRGRYHDEVMFHPREYASALVRAQPVIISIIDLPKGPGEPDLVRADAEGLVRHVRNSAQDRSGALQTGSQGAGVDVEVRYARSGAGGYRPGAPY